MTRRYYLLFFATFLFSYFSIVNAQDFVINDYDVSIVLNEDGTADITENIKLTFLEERRGIIRRIPNRFKLENKSNRLGIKNVKVEGWNFNTDSEDGYTKIQIGDPEIYVSGTQRYEISYHAHNALVWIDQAPNFYWNVIGTEWNTRIDRAKFDIEFPNALNISDDDISLFGGQLGSRKPNQLTFELQGNNIRGQTLSSLAKNEGITVGFAIPEGYYEMPTRLKKGWKNNRIFALPLGFLGVILFLFRKHGYQSKIRISEGDLIPYPPDKMSPEEIGMYVDGIIHTRDILSLIPWWADHEFITITGIEGINSQSDLMIQKIKDLGHNYPEHQHTFFNTIFKKGDSVLLSDLKESSSAQLHKARVQLGKFMRKSYLFEHGPSTVFWKGWIVVLGFVFAAAAIISGIVFSEFLTCLLFALAGLTCFVIPIFPKRMSTEGKELKARILGFKNFLKHGEPSNWQNIIAENPNYFSEMIPYAIALGLDKKLMKLYESYRTPAPHWYRTRRNSDVMDVILLDHFFNHFNTTDLQKSYAHTPTTNSHSGGSISGGGFSGGGMGGGGGSSW